ncbi:hypothetical protein TSMEX_001227 [Taenia solium]|eukprot:TsM_001172400 transcript=TsM_001172400 gene=TsM_001172400
MGASIRIHLPERFNHKLAMHLGFLQEVINGPLYSVITFVNKGFVGPLVDLFFRRSALPGDIFIIALEGSLEIDICPPECEETQSELRRVCVSGDVVYIPHQFEHRAKLSECGTSHAIVLSVINRAPVLVEECWEHLLEKLNLKEPNNEGCSLFRELLMSTHNNPRNASDILYIDLNSEEGVEFVFRRWLKSVVGVHGRNKKEAIDYAAYELRERFLKQLPAVNLDSSEKMGHAAFLAPSLDDSNVHPRSRRERLLNPHVEGRVKFERELKPTTSIRLTRRSVLGLVRRRGDAGGQEPVQ